MYRIRKLAAVTVFVLATGGSGVALGYQNPGSDDHRQDPYTVALFGDMPYGAAGRAEYPRLIEDTNAAPVRFAMCYGDMKGGDDGHYNDTQYNQWLNWLEAPNQL